MRRTFQSLVAIVVILGIGLPVWYWIVAGAPQPPAAPPADLGPVPVQVQRVAPSDLALEVAVYGTLLPRRRVTLASELAGRIGRVHPGWVQGAEVQAGDELVALDPGPFELAVQQAVAALSEAESWIRSAELQRAAAETALENARERRDVALREHERLASIVDIAGESTVDKAWDAYLSARTAADQAEAALVAAEESEVGARARRAKAEAARAVAEDQLVRSRVTAPFSGKLVGRAPVAGAYVTPGVTFGELVDVATLVLSASVPEDELIDVRVGQRAEVVPAGRAEVTRAEPLAAVVTAVSPQVNALRSGTVEIELANDDPERPLAAGLFCEGRIRTVTVPGAVVIARRHFQWREGVPVAFVVNRSGDVATVERRALSFDRPYGEGFLVAAGLSAGDELVTRPLDRLRDGAACAPPDDAHSAPAGPAGTNGRER